MHNDTGKLGEGRLVPNFTLPQCDGGEAFTLRALKPRPPGSEAKRGYGA